MFPFPFLFRLSPRGGELWFLLLSLFVELF
nr:MAG TPA: hypothetical protein [Caudoviricetes sp.]